MTPGRWFAPALFAALAVVLSFLTLPTVAIFVRATPRELLAGLDDPGVLDALWLSLRTTLAALAIILLAGTPVAYLLATRTFRGHALVVTCVELPMVLPPAVAGVGLLAALGPGGILGGTLETLGIGLVFQAVGVVAALTFVAAPYFIRGCPCGIRRGRSNVAGRVTHARHRRGRHLLAHRDSGRRPRHGRRSCARLRAGGR